MVHKKRIRNKNHAENSNHNIYRMRLVARNNIQLSSSKCNNVENMETFVDMQASVADMR